jgi:hypothetical protein
LAIASRVFKPGAEIPSSLVIKMRINGPFAL